jgi:hypothetical protein
MMLVTSFRQRVESMLTMAEFSTVLEWLKPAIDAVMLNAKGNSTTIERRLKKERWNTRKGCTDV